MRTFRVGGAPEDEEERDRGGASALALGKRGGARLPTRPRVDGGRWDTIANGANVRCGGCSSHGAENACHNASRGNGYSLSYPISIE